ncbi:phage holin [Tsukamurella pseudospumae]|nr:hypothetical protein [Tsukamurella pseudospumae]
MNDIRSRIFRRRIPESARRAVYTVAGPLITILAAGGIISTSHAAAWTSLVLAIVTLVIAVVNGEAGWRNAVYVLTGTLQALLQGYGIGTDAVWASVSGLVVALLGIGLAAAFTPSGLTAEAAAPPAAEPVVAPPTRLTVVGTA